MTQQAQAWWEAYDHVISPHHAEYLQDEFRASAITTYCMPLVPGLLQTENYAAAVLRHFLLFKDDDLTQKRVRLRMERQWRVLERADPPNIHYLIGERALHRKIGGAEVLREQLMHLADITKLANIKLQIVPTDYWESPFIIDPGSCHLFSFHDKHYKDVIYEERVHPGAEIRRSDNAVELQYWNQAFERISHDALDPETSRKLISRRMALLLKESA